jgi:hypothetical protein
MEQANLVVYADSESAVGDNVFCDYAVNVALDGDSRECSEFAVPNVLIQPPILPACPV